MDFSNYMTDHERMVSRVLDLVINLIDLPSSASLEPSASDITLFRQAIQKLQPKDWDDMVIERNIYEKCAYPLCSFQPLVFDREARDRIFGKRKNYEIFIDSKAELDKWCSVECIEKGLFVRLQLRPEPHWLRDSNLPDVIIMEDTMTIDGKTKVVTDKDTSLNLANRLQELAIEQGKEAAIEERMKELAIERGDESTQMREGVIMRDVQENAGSSIPSAPIGRGHVRHDAIEGYQPRDVQEMLRQTGR